MKWLKVMIWNGQQMQNVLWFIIYSGFSPVVMSLKMQLDAWKGREYSCTFLHYSSSWSSAPFWVQHLFDIMLFFPHIFKSNLISKLGKKTCDGQAHAFSGCRGGCLPAGDGKLSCKRREKCSRSKANPILFVSLIKLKIVFSLIKSN